MSNFRTIQYVGNKPTKRDTILRTDRQWTRGSTVDVPTVEAGAYLRHKDIFRDVTDQLDEAGNPPSLPSLKPRRPDNAAPLAEENTLRELKAEIDRLNGELDRVSRKAGGAGETLKEKDAEIEHLTTRINELNEEVAALTEDNNALREQLKQLESGQNGNGAGSEPTDATERQKSIINALAQLDRDKDFGNDGKPKVDAISKALGWKISGAERDAAWDAVLEANKG